MKINFPVNKIRKDFPILKQKINGSQLVYFDNAATTQKPQQVTEAVVDFYQNYNSNIHRGIHYLSEEATILYEQSRNKIKDFLNADKTNEIIFTKGTTESINLVASSYGELLQEGDEIIISEMEHNANVVPWQILSRKKNIKLKIIPLTKDFQLDFDAYRTMFSKRTKLVALTYISNVIGTINDIRKFTQVAHIHRVPVLVDAAQAVQHKNIDVKKIDADFLVFSGHKMYAETGIGVLYAKEYLLEKMPPYQYGSVMIENISKENISFAPLPYKFEAGTPNYVAAHSLKTAIDYLENIGLEQIWCYEGKLTDYAIERLSSEIKGIKIYATQKSNKTSIISFNVAGIHFYDIAQMLDNAGIAVRVGKHSAHLLIDSLKIEGTVRVSFSFYNTFDEIDYFVDTLKEIVKMLN